MTTPTMSAESHQGIPAVAKPMMIAEDAFLSSLRSAKRWRIDGDKLIIEGDAARLMLKPGVAELKPEKPAKRPHPGR